MNNFQRFTDKVVIVTGSTNGIGQATAFRFGKEGAKLTIHGRDAEGMKETHEKLNAEGVQDDRILEVYGDVVEEKTLRELVDKTVERYGGIDIVVNNAASSAGQAGLDTADIESLDYIFDQNVKSYMKLVHFAMPFLEKSKGNVVNVSSVDGVRPHPESMNYSVSKAAVDHYCRNASVTFAKKGVRINNLNPGYIHTEIKMREPDMDEKKLKEFETGWVKRNVPMGRPGQSYEMANVICFLASDEASFITGECIIADGGLRNYGEPQDS